MPKDLGTAIIAFTVATVFIIVSPILYIDHKDWYITLPFGILFIFNGIACLTDTTKESA